MTDNNQIIAEDHEVHERAPSRPFVEWINMALVIVQTGTLAVGLPNLITGSGVGYNLKITLLTLGAGIVSYGVLHVAVKFLAPLAAKKFRMAAIASVVGIGIVGGGFALATTSGSILPDVAALELQDHGTDVAVAIGQVDRLATEASRGNSTLGVISADLLQWSRCEEHSSCLSLAPVAGRGSIAIVLEELAERAASIQEQVSLGEETREDALDEINEHFAAYQETLGDPDKSVWQKRNELKLTDNLIHQASTKLSESVPLHLIRQYAEELDDGITLSGRADVAQRINKILGSHAKNLDAILKTINADAIIRPAFPARPGVDDALTHALSFLPIFLLIAAIDLVLPISVWIMAYLQSALAHEIAARRHQNQSPRKQERNNNVARMPRRGNGTANGKGKNFGPDAHR